MIRIAQRAWATNRAAENADEMTAAVRVEWIDVAGVMLPPDRVVSATVTADAGIQRITVELIGPAEFVYLDADGDPVA